MLSLYISHSLSAWNIRLIEFGSVLFIAQLYPTTLLPASLYALVRSCSAIFFSGSAGALVDRLDRLQTIRVAIKGQRISSAATCGILYVLAVGNHSDAFDKAALGILALFACVEKLASILNAIAVERDWVVVIANGDEGLLRTMNSQMRRIDLFCKLVAPLSLALTASFSVDKAILITLGMSVVSLPVEYIQISRVYHSYPALRLPPARQERNAASASREPAQAGASIALSFGSVLSRMFDGALYYITHRAFLPSLSLCLLYLTVFSFNGQLIAYLTSLGYSPSTIGLMRTASAIAELSSTFIAPLAMNHIGPIRCGIRALNWQLLCVAVATGALWSPTPSTIALMVAVIASRIGLWCFDLSAQLLIQEAVEPAGRGRFSAIEAAVQNAFELGSFAMTIIWSRPQEFKIPGAVSSVSVAAATICFSVYTRRERGHLFHTPACVDCHRAGAKGWARVAQTEAAAESTQNALDEE